MNRFLNAVRFLTIFPVQRWGFPTSEQMGESMVFFPFVGAILGLILVGIGWLLSPIFPAGVIAAVLVGLLIAMTGGLHWDGVADTFDGLGGAKGDKERMLTIMKDSRIGSLGVLSLSFMIVFKVGLLAELPAAYWKGALILMPMTGRFVQLEMAVWGRYARKDGGTGRAFVEGAKPGDFWLALVGVGIISLLALGWAGVGIVALNLLYGYGVMAFFNRKIGGITGDILGMASETSEILALILVYFFK